jgi:hypothetical protein
MMVKGRMGSVGRFARRRRRRGRKRILGNMGNLIVVGEQRRGTFRALPDLHWDIVSQ